ncbi:Magnesium transporter MRS2-11, chloroplastic [Dichanthelium oligosanthes]|uniref:Magnesium transporter MRS2-11, chloroplastic n=1 Tax=Dichanthelium oligosanthes TaxID=888268 RepID=A0A1E5WJ43_9POAL|nr:Magnesium transporter MRS2-11, chloroplastic [Dichanthelium oligosanthes]
MASVPLSASSQAGLLLLPLPLLQPPGAGACLRYRLLRLPPGLASVRKGGLLPLPLLAPPRAAEGKDGRAVTKEEVVEEEEVEVRKEGEEEGGDGGGAREEAARGSGRFAADYISLGIREPVYEVGGQQAQPRSSLKWPLTEVIEVRSNGRMSTKKISRRQLLKSSGLRLRDTRSVDPSLWLMNSMPSLLVVEAALLSRILRLEQRLMKIEPSVATLLEVLPNRLTADVLEQLRLSKQALVELGSRAGDLKQMLIDLLEDPHEIRRICIMGRNCTLDRLSDDMECSVPLDKQIAEEEEEEIEMLLENYLQRCESCHGQAERLLDSAREMEDSIAVNLSSRRLEVSRVELLLQVGTFCVAIGALIAGIFGMNLKSYLETNSV